MSEEEESENSIRGVAPITVPPDAERGSRLRLGLLGVNAWIVAVVAPTSFVGYPGHGALVALLLPPTVLAVGVLAMTRRPERARWALLAGYPLSVATALGVQPALTERDAYGTLGLLVAALALLAFVAAAGHALRRGLGTRPAHARPLGGQAPVGEPAARRLLRRALLGASAVTALALTLVAPTLEERRERARRWGEATDDATVLAIVTGTLVAVVMLALIVGPNLRAARARPPRAAQRRIRVATALFLALSAAAGWAALRVLEG